MGYTTLGDVMRWIWIGCGVVACTGAPVDETGRVEAPAFSWDAGDARNISSKYGNA